jgi:threonine/homoserine/homoserine lactone efflux protein
VFGQSLILGVVQVTLSVTVNSIVAMTAGSIAAFLGQRPFWLVVQRWLMGTVLASIAVRMATEARR